MTKFVKDVNRNPKLVKSGRGKQVNTFICFGKF